MVEFGIQVAAPAAEEMGDRHGFYRDLLNRGSEAFTSFWVSDHLMKEDSSTLEGWTALTYLAGEFPSYKVGNLVLSQGYRNPALLAKMASTLQSFSGGKVMLGLGAGWQADEYEAYGYPYPNGSVRVEQLGEAIDVIRAMWTEAPANYEGTYYHVRDAYCMPQPDPMIPILVGGRRPKLLRVAAAKADWWSWDGPIERYGPLVEQLRAACDEVGRTLPPIRLHSGGEAYFPDDPADFPVVGDPAGTMAAVTEAQDPQGLYAADIDWVLGPTPEDAIRGLQPLVDLGVEIFTIYFHDRRTLDLFAREVIPAFR